MSLEIKKTEGISTQNASTPALSSGTSSDVQITLNKNQEIPQPDKKTEEKIKNLLKSINPDINWDELTNLQKQKCIQHFYDGTLEKKIQEIEAKNTELRNVLKQMTPEQGSKKLVAALMSRIDSNFENLPEAKKQEEIAKTSEKMLKAMHPDLDIESLNEFEKKQISKQYDFQLQTALFALQSGKIDKLYELKNLSPAEMKDLEYEFAKSTLEANPDMKQNYNMQKAFAQGNLERAIAEQNGIKLDEFRNSEDKYGMMYEYLKGKPEKDLNAYERRQLKQLEKLAFIYGEDFKGINLAKDNSIEESYLNQFTNGKEINWDDSTQQQILLQKLKADLSECKTTEAKQARMAAILASMGSLDEAMILSEAFAKLEKQKVVTVNDLYIAAKQAKITTHGFVANSKEMSVQGQICTAKHVAANCKGEHAQFTDKQAAGYTKNIIPDYEVEAQAPSTNTMTDTGLQAVYDVLPETYSKLDESAAKEAYEYAMTSENISADQKAIMARDTIDMFGDNKDMQEFFESIANKNNIDYKSVPPKSERAKTEKAADKAEENVTNTNYTEQELTEILNSSAQPQNFFMTALNGARETLEIILGKTPDTNTVKAEVQKIDSINTAISELKSGAKLTDVFKGSTLSVQKDLVGLICSYGKIAIGQLIDAFGGETIYKMAKNKNHKELIKKEIERIALSDSTQRVALAEIKKQEAKQGFMSRA